MRGLSLDEVRQESKTTVTMLGDDTRRKSTAIPKKSASWREVSTGQGRQEKHAPAVCGDRGMLRLAARRKVVGIGYHVASLDNPRVGVSSREVKQRGVIPWRPRQVP